MLKELEKALKNRKKTDLNLGEKEELDGQNGDIKILDGWTDIYIAKPSVL